MNLEVCGQEAQEDLGKSLAAVCPEACVVYLQGDLGAGKTTLVRGFLRGWGYQGMVKSPTYTLMEPYQEAGRRCFHLDLYRLAAPDELEYLGLRDLLTEPAVLMIEWPEQGQGMLPAADLLIEISHKGACRLLELGGNSDKGRDLLKNFPWIGSGIKILK